MPTPSASLSSSSSQSPPRKDQEARLDDLRHPRALLSLIQLRDRDLPLLAGWSIVFSNMIPRSHITEQNGKNLILPYTANSKNALFLLDCE